MSTILLTGATGFVGGAVLNRLIAADRISTAAVRSTTASVSSRARRVVVPSLDAYTGWSDALEACGVVIHSAARVHVMEEQSADPLTEFRKVNVDGTLNLARQAAAAGVK